MFVIDCDKKVNSMTWFGVRYGRRGRGRGGGGGVGKGQKELLRSIPRVYLYVKYYV